MIIAILAAVAASSLQAVPGVHASDVCTQQVDLVQMTAICQRSPQEAQAIATGGGAGGGGATYEFLPSCETLSLGACHEVQACVGPPPGFLYDIYRDGELVGQVCFTEEEAPPVAAAPVITPGMVLRAFRRLSWPVPELVVQPPGGRTLVNLPTIFSTTVSEPTTQTVTLLGRQVSITATPESFTWHPGGGMPAWTTDHPGQPYSEALAPEEHIHVVYVDAGGTAQAHVAVTYRGSYRIGNGPEQPIPETLTVSGAPVSMRILEAQPKLVGSN